MKLEHTVREIVLELNTLIKTQVVVSHVPDMLGHAMNLEF